jgi:acyl-coenzyme A thioesterase PaaI-like protein
MISKIKVSASAYRFFLNLWPCIRSSGGRVTHISKDFTELDIKLTLNWRTRNVVGTIFGGSMYASTDPFFMLMLMQILGPNYVVWDKVCTLRFKRPAKEAIYAQFRITPEMLNDVYENVENHGQYSFTWTITFKDKTGVIYSEFDKVLYVAKKDVYKAKLEAKKI